MRLAGVIIAGGKSSRMGEEKALAMLGGKPLLAHVIDRIRPQVNDLIVNANGDASRFQHFGLTVVPDLRSDIGTPLAGLHAALTWAREQGYDAALTVPSDAPFLPRDLLARLKAAKADAAIAASADQAHFLTGLWSHGLLEKLEHAIEIQNIFRVKDWVKACSAATVTWPDQPFDPFFNVNTPQELAEAERITAEFNP
jgi:molybdopterin-guanine dinucleotide biosynthesis protein A